MKIFKGKNGDICIVPHNNSEYPLTKVLNLKKGKISFEKIGSMEELNEVRIRYTEKFFLSSNLREDFFLDMNGFWVTKKKTR